ncbi:MAG: N-acetylmuramoyl-L-alanine amidase [Nitrospirae bacterium]|nr:N-acetylmuramoyl-L-alanine amidase [Nitrospirota bacterium]
MVNFNNIGMLLRKGFLPVILFGLIAVQTFAANDVRTSADSQSGRGSTATLRVGRHAHYVRLVFETPETYVQKASVILTGANSIKIDFQTPISFRVPQKGAPKTLLNIQASGSGTPYEIDNGLKITVNVSSCIIFVENLDDINVSKLSSPSRLVIDAYISQAAPSEGGRKDAVEAPLTAPDASEIKVESFAIDAGHGGYESGLVFGKITEKDLALSVSKELAGTLVKKGKKVVLTRKGDQVVSLRDRAGIVNKRSPDLMVSIHLSSRNEFVVYTGLESRVKAPGEDRSEAVAKAIARSAKNVLKINVRLEKMPLALLAYVHVPAVLIELPSPEKFSYDGKSRERMIAIILQGVAYSSSGQVQA